MKEDYQQLIENALSQLGKEVKVWYDEENNHYCIKIIESKKIPSSFDEGIDKILNYNPKKKE